MVEPAYRPARHRASRIPAAGRAPAGMRSSFVAGPAALPVSGASSGVARLAREMRTPLNDVLTLARRLAEDAGHTLSPRQIDYAQTIYSAGSDLLLLLDDLDTLLDGRGAAAHRLAATVNATAPRVYRERPAPVPVQPHPGPGDGEGLVLVAESDARRADILLDVARSNGYRGIIAGDLGTLGALARERRPAAILLGEALHDADAWTAFELLRQTPATQVVPLCLTALSPRLPHSLHLDGGDGVAGSPADALWRMAAASGQPVRRLLLVDGGGPRQAAAWRKNGIEVVASPNPARALKALGRGGFDGMAIGAGLREMGRNELLRQLVGRLPDMEGLILPLALYSDGPAGVPGDVGGWRAEIATLHARHRLDKVIDDTTAFLWRALGPGRPDGGAKAVPANGDILRGRKVLIIDDDLRHRYALAGALEAQGMVVLHAADGQEGLATLDGNPDADAILMHDAHNGEDGDSGEGGGDFIRHLRGLDGFGAVPIIAMTAGGNDGQRRKYLAAGASDDLPRPVNVEQLLSLLRAWLAEPRDDPAH